MLLNCIRQLTISKSKYFNIINSSNKFLYYFSNKCNYSTNNNTDSQKATQNNKDQKRKSIIDSSVIESNQNEQQHQQVSTHVSFGQKAKEGAKTAYYSAVIASGALFVGYVVYLLFDELFTRESPTGIYNESSKICLDNIQIQDALGPKIKVSAESGGRRVFNIRSRKYRDTQHRECLLINYYLTGSKNKATIHVKVHRKSDKDKYEYEYIVAELEYPHRGDDKIIVQRSDN